MNQFIETSQSQEAYEQTWSVRITDFTETDEDIARYSILHGNEQLFASKYKLYLPTEEELRNEIETQKAIFYLQQKEKLDS